MRSQRFANAGSFVPLHVITEPGSVFDASGTAPHGFYFETRIRLFDLLWQCVAQALPGRLPMGHFASICGTVIAGEHADTGRRYTLVEPQMGGWGATAERDGMDAMYSTSHGDTFKCPVEICEARYGLEVVHKSLASRQRVAGVHQGGHGVSLRYRLRADAVLSVGFTRARVPVWSHPGCAEGGRNSVALLRPGQDPLALGFASGVSLQEGDELLIETASGGNYPAFS